MLQLTGTDLPSTMHAKLIHPQLSTLEREKESHRCRAHGTTAISDHLSHIHINISLSPELIARRAATKSVGSHIYKKSASIACINHSCCIQHCMVCHDMLWAMRLLGIHLMVTTKYNKTTSCSTESINRKLYDNTCTKAGSCIQVAMHGRQHARSGE